MYEISKLLKLQQERMDDYVVSRAAVICTVELREAQMVFPDRGYDTGYGRVGLDIDTSITRNFSNLLSQLFLVSEDLKEILSLFMPEMGDQADTDIKSICTRHQKEIVFAPESIFISNGTGSHIELQDTIDITTGRLRLR